jgi:ligand-binding sensor domain-containing protein
MTGTSGPETQATYAVSCYGKEIWFAASAGIAAYDADTKEWLTPPARLYEVQSPVNRIQADELAVWAVTDDGVLKYDRQAERWVHFGMEDGLPCHRINAVLVDGDYVWFGSEQGLTCFYWNAPYRID